MNSSDRKPTHMDRGFEQPTDQGPERFDQSGP